MLFQFCIVFILISNSFTFGHYLRDNDGRDASFYYETKEIFQSVLRSYVASGNSLRTLFVEGINLNIINDDLFEMDNLQDMKNITLLHCNIQSISDSAFVKFTSLQYLSIIGNQLKTLTTNFLLPLGNLIELDLSNNEIMSLNMNCTNLKLQSLKLNDNPLRYSEKLECKSENLLRLELKNTAITDLNFALQFFKVHKLNVLDISNNLILQLNYDFSFLSNLKELNLRNTSLSTINYQAFAGLNFLESLNLESNQITKIPCNSFKDTHALKTLKLNNNSIDVVFICSFKFLESLTHLHLQHNYISNIEVGTFSSLSSLKYLDISYNKLSNIDETAIHPLERLEVLDISANYFKNLNPALVFGNLRFLKQIDLSGNFWTCSNLSYARNYLRLRNINYESKILNYEQENIGGIQCFSNYSYSILNENKTQLRNSTNITINHYHSNSTKLENNLTNNVSTLSDQSYHILIFIIILLICIYIFDKYISKLKCRKQSLNYNNNTRTEMELLNNVPHCNGTHINS